MALTSPRSHFKSARERLGKLESEPSISPVQGADPGPSQGPSRISPTLHCVYKGEAEAGTSVQLSAQIDCSPPLLYQQDSSDKDTLLEAALAPGTLPGIFPPYPYIGHYSPPSPSVASFRWLLLLTPQHKSLCGHPKDLAVSVSGEMSKGDFIRSMPLTLEWAPPSLVIFNRGRNLKNF